MISRKPFHAVANIEFDLRESLFHRVLFDFHAPKLTCKTKNITEAVPSNHQHPAQQWRRPYLSVPQQHAFSFPVS